MPCDCSHMDPTYDENESTKVCKLICFIFERTKKDIPDWIQTAADDYYGDARRLVEAEEILFDTIQNLNKEDKNAYIYNAWSRNSRLLVDWYEDFLEKLLDKKEFERIRNDKIQRAESILSKIRSDDVEILRNYLQGSI